MLSKIYFWRIFMKKRFLGVFFLFVCGFLSAQQALTLDDAIYEAAGEIVGKVRRNSKVAILDISSRSGRMSSYIQEELMAAVVNEGTVIVVEREDLDLIADEMNFQMSGEVSDKSAASLGQKLGAQYIVTGSFDQAGSNYRFRIKVVEVEKAAVRLMFNENVLNDATVADLVGRRSAPTTATASSNVAAGAPGEQKILDASKAAILAYFKKYKPQAKAEGNKVHGEAQYGKYKVKIDVTPSGSGYTIEIDSLINNNVIEKWKTNIRREIDKRLG
jgi:TolB-like protein